MRYSYNSTTGSLNSVVRTVISGVGNLALEVTCDSIFAGKDITATKSGTTLTQVCPSTSPYIVRFEGVEPGTWTISGTADGNTFTTEAVVQDTSAVLNYGFVWSTWVGLSQTLDPSDYSSLDDLLEDEEAIRELMTIHDCVDYLAQFEVVTPDLEKIINNDLCAKWINLRDYALDTLAANPAIKEAMDVSHKELKPQIPTMTSNTAPYGEASASNQSSDHHAYIAFDGNDTTRWETVGLQTSSGVQLGYKFVNPVCIKSVKLFTYKDSNTLTSYTVKIQASNSGFESNMVDLTDVITITNDSQKEVIIPVENDNYYINYWVVFLSPTAKYQGYNYFNLNTLQFYAYEYSSKYNLGEWVLKSQVPTMTSNTAPYGEASASGSWGGDTTNYGAWRAFSGSLTDSWLSAHNTYGWVQYKFVNPICIKKIYLAASTGICSGKIQASNDGTNFVDLAQFNSTSNTTLEVEIDNNDFYLYYRFTPTSYNYINGSIRASRVDELQFYAWAPKGNVPVMTSNSAPYGTAFASDKWPGENEPYVAFNNTVTGSWYSYYNTYGKIGYKFTNPVCVTKFKMWQNHDVSTATSDIGYGRADGKLQGSNDNGTTWVDIHSFTKDDLTENGITVSNSAYYLSYRIIFSSYNYKDSTYKADKVKKLQFYGRELKVSVPTMTSNTAPYGEASASSTFDATTTYAAFRAFDLPSDNKKWNSAANGGSQYVQYKFTHKIVPKVLGTYVTDGNNANTNITFDFEGSNDGSTFYPLTGILGGSTSNTVRTSVTQNEGEYQYIRLQQKSGTNGMASTNITIYGLDYSEKEFEAGTTKKWLYDHGVLLNNQTWDSNIGYAGYTKNGTDEDHSSWFRLYRNYSSSTGNTMIGRALNNLIDFTDYSLCRMRDNLGTTTQVVLAVSSINGSYYLGVISSPNYAVLVIASNKSDMSANNVAITSNGDNAILDVSELWLE